VTDYNRGFELLKEAEIKIAELEEALRIACADAWPDNPHWPELYMQRARNNMQVQRTER
jgi:hypothetical protein